MNPQPSRRFASLLTLLRGPGGGFSHRRRGTIPRGRRLGFELCEDRDLLNGASITGVKYDTANSSGFSAGDVPQGGVWIDLYKDTGDAVFNTASDTLADRRQTAAGTGAFAFNNVADGHYYIQEEVPAGTTQSAGPAFYTVDVVGGAVYTGSTLIVDQFNGPNFVYFINQFNSNPFTRNDSVSGIPGNLGQRNLTVNVLGTSNPISASGFVANGVFRLATASSGPGTQVTMQYDANGVGLTADLTAGGNNSLRLDFDYLQVGTGTTMDMKIVLTSPGGTTTYTTSVTQNGGAFSVIVPFASFSPTGFTFNNVSSAQFSFNDTGVQDVDFELDQIVGALQRNTGYNFGNFPLPSSLAGFVYVDANNNGNKDVSEPPISGVIVTLMGVNDLGQSVTQTTTTAGNGAYFFGSLRPGIYKLTETQPINFIDGKDTIGTPGGITSNDMFSNINLPADFNGINNNFGELGLTPTYSSKRSLLSPSPPVNLVAVYPTTMMPGTVTNNAPSVTSAATLVSTPNTSPTVKTAVKTAVATTRTSSVKVLVTSVVKPGTPTTKRKH